MNTNLREAAIHGTKDYPFTIYDIHLENHPFNVSLHWHDEMEIIYINQGPLYITINKQNFVGESGDIYIVNPTEIHGMHSAPPASYGTVLFSLSYLMFAETDYVAKQYLLHLLHGHQKIRNEISDSHLRESIFLCIQDILSVNRLRTSAYQLGTKVILLDILYKIIQADHIIHNNDFSNRNETNRRVLSYISSHYTEKLTLQEMADTFGMSYKYFSRYFAKKFQTTFSDYVTGLRIEHAENLLSSTSLPVTDVALQSGFNNISFFIRYFKRVYGVSPLKYRKQKS